MSFTISCNECGWNMKMKDKDVLRGGEIDIVVDASFKYSQYEVQGIDIYCENIKCLNSIFLKEGY